MSDRPLFGAVEGGGTKFVCALGASPTEVLRRVTFPTEDPETTLGRVAAFFADEPVISVGVGMFGPLDLEAGATLATPKAGWTDVPVRAHLEAALGVRVAVDTDVNAAALGEHLFGAGEGADPCLYVTVGTGVGGGVVVHGRPLHGLVHPEFGHLMVPDLPLGDGTRDSFEGSCPFHGRCLEGLVSGPAIAARVGKPAEDLAEDDPVWDLVGRYLGAGLASAVLLLSPQKIVLGGGVGGREGLLPRIREGLTASLGDYLLPTSVRRGIAEYVVAPGLGANAAIAGALALAESHRDLPPSAAPSPVDASPAV